MLKHSSDTWYWEQHSESSKTIIFLHGFPGNHRGLTDLAKYFPKQYRLVVPDMPACGKTPPMSHVHTLENYAAWLAGFLDDMDIANPIIIGHSFGARVALTFATHYPTRLEKLVLLTPVVSLHGIFPRIASLKGVIAKILPEYMKKPWLANPLYQYAVERIIFKSADKQLRQEITNNDIAESKNLDVKATIEVFDEFYQSDLLPLASKVTVPCLIIAGGKDEVATPKSVKQFAAESPEFFLHSIPVAGHLLPLENPEETAIIINNWLNP